MEAKDGELAGRGQRKGLGVFLKMGYKYELTSVALGKGVVEGLS